MDSSIENCAPVDAAEKRARFGRLKQFLNYDSNNLSLQTDLLVLAVELGETEVALEIVANANEVLKQTPNFCAHAGYLFLILCEYAKALDYFMISVGGGLNNPVVMTNMSYCYFFLGEYQKAYDTLANLGGLSELSSECIILKARALHHLDKLEEAINLLNEFLATSTDHVEANGLLSLIMFEHGFDPKTALKHANKALLATPTQIEALLARAALSLEVGDYLQAEMDAAAATQHHPENGRAWSALAQVHFNAYRFDASRDAAEKAVTWMKNHIGTWHLLGWAFILLGEFENALDAFERSYELDHRFGETHGGLAAAYAMLNRDHLARKHLVIAKKLNVEGFAAVFAEMALLRRAGDVDLAQQIFEQAISRQSTQLGIAPRMLIARRLHELGGSAPGAGTVH